MKKFLSKILIFCMLFTVVATTSATPQTVFASSQATYYVSPTGSDSNDGLASTSPFQTIEHAQSVVRSINSNMTGDIIIYLMGGTYTLTSALSFTSADSGTNGYNVIYMAYNGETPVISGGQTIMGWTLYSGGIYRAYVGPGFQTRQLYVNGTRAQRARGEDNPSGFSVSQSGVTLPASGTYSNMASWGNVSDIEIVTSFSWKHARVGISSVSGRNVTMKSPAWGYAYTQPSYGPNTVNWVENAYELLDTAGEWYLDRSTGYIYYIPRTGENMSTASVVAGSAETLLSASGTLDVPIQNIQFNGITFSYNTWLMPNGNDGYPDYQAGVIYHYPGTWDVANWKTPAAVTFSAAKSITISNCTFTHIGNAALNFDYGSQNNLIDYNTFTDVSGNGINIGGIDKNVDHHPTDLRICVKNNTVSNNTITNIGVEYWDNAGIFVGYTDGTVIKHNTIHDIPYTAISAGYGWGYIDTLGTSVAKNNKISHNLIYNFMMTSIDGGGIYTLGSQPGSQVYNNYIYGDKNPYAFLYRDNGTSGYFDTNNVISSLNSNCNNWYFTNTSSGGYWDAHDNNAFYNYYSAEMTTMQTGGTNVVGSNYAVSNYAWDTTAQAIIANAGVGGGDGPAPNFVTPAPVNMPSGPNLALNQPTQVSNYYQNNASYNGSKAVDGSTSTRWATDNGITSAWLEIDFPTSTTFDCTVLRECQDYGARIQSYQIQYWNGTNWITAYSGSNPGWSGQRDDFPAVTSTKVRLNISNCNAPTVWEFGVYNNSSTAPVNLALNKTATQSSTGYGGTADRAVDGNTDGDFYNNSVTHTNNDSQAWWMVDLGNTYNLGDIKIYNRTDAAMDRLSDYNIIVLDQNNSQVWSNHQTVYPNPSTTVNAGGISGRYVKIQLTGTNNLSLAEVQVYSYAPPAASNLKLWLKADTGVTIDTNNKVSAWADQSGCANNAAQATAGYQPVLVNNVINSKPIVRFDGVDDNILSSGVTGSMNSFTVMFVLKPSTVANYNQNLGAAGMWGQYAFHTTSAGEIYTGTSTSSRITPADGTGADTMVANNWYKFSYVFNNGSAKLYKNGTLLASKTLSIPSPWTGFTLGQNTANTLYGDITEIFVYNEALSDTDRQNIETYLSSKYGF